MFGGVIPSVPKIQPPLPPLYSQKQIETSSLLNTCAVAVAGIVKLPPLKHLPILPLAEKDEVPETSQGDIPKSLIFPLSGHQCIKLIKTFLSFNNYAKMNSMQSSVELYCTAALPATLNLVAYK